MKTKRRFLAICVLGGLLQTAGASIVRAATYDFYINNISTPAAITAQNQPWVDRLVNEINKLDQTGDGVFDHFAPAMFVNGINANMNPANGILLWGTPAELISTLSGAYPYLPAALQTKVKTYLDSEIAAYPPLSVAYYPPNSGTIQPQAGIRREFFPVDTNHPINFWPGINVSIGIAYPLWQYTNATKDRRFVDTASNWNSLVSLYNNFKSANSVKSYYEIAGLTGFARLALLKGDATTANDAIAFAKTAMQNTTFGTFSSNADSDLAAYRETFPVFLFGVQSQCCTNLLAGVFAKEVGQYLHDNELAAVQSYSTRLELHDPLWYLTMPNWGGDPTNSLNDENFYATPEFGWTNLMIHAYVFKEDFQKVKTYPDCPSRWADLFYIQSLVAVIESVSTGSPNATPPAAPTSLRLK